MTSPWEFSIRERGPRSELSVPKTHAGTDGRLSTNALKRIRCSPASETVDWVRQWLAAAASNAAVHELDPGGAILAILRLDTEGERGVSSPRSSGSRSLVVPVETAGLADLNDLADLRRLHSPGLWAVHLEGLVAAPEVVVREVVFEDPP